MAVSARLVEDQIRLACCGRRWAVVEVELDHDAFWSPLELEIAYVSERFEWHVRSLVMEYGEACLVEAVDHSQ